MHKKVRRQVWGEIIQKREDRRAWRRGGEKWGWDRAGRRALCVCVWGAGSEVKEAAVPLFFLKFQLLFGNKTELEVIAERQRERMWGRVGGAEGALTWRASDLNRSLISVCKLQLPPRSPLSSVTLSFITHSRLVSVQSITPFFSSGASFTSPSHFWLSPCLLVPPGDFCRLPHVPVAS